MICVVSLALLFSFLTQYSRGSISLDLKDGWDASLGLQLQATSPYLKPCTEEKQEAILSPLPSKQSCSCMCPGLMQSGQEGHALHRG